MVVDLSRRQSSFHKVSVKCRHSAVDVDNCRMGPVKQPHCVHASNVGPRQGNLVQLAKPSPQSFSVVGLKQIGQLTCCQISRWIKRAGPKFLFSGFFVPQIVGAANLVKWCLILKFTFYEIQHTLDDFLVVEISGGNVDVGNEQHFGDRVIESQASLVHLQ